MQGGQLDGAAVTAIGLSMIDESIRVLELPMMFQNVDEVDYVADKMWPYFQAKFEKKGFKLLDRGEVGWIYFMSKNKMESLNDLRGQISADVRDSILDIQAAAKQVAVSRSNVALATEALSEAQQRYAAGVSDNLAVSQAQASMAQADDQYVSSLYQHNVAKLSLARALGIAQANYKDYVGGK